MGYPIEDHYDETHWPKQYHRYPFSGVRINQCFLAGGDEGPQVTRACRLWMRNTDQKWSVVFDDVKCKFRVLRLS